MAALCHYNEHIKINNNNECICKAQNKWSSDALGVNTHVCYRAVKIYIVSQKHTKIAFVISSIKVDTIITRT